MPQRLAMSRAEAVDGKGYVPPGTQPIGYPGKMSSNANAAVQYDNGWEWSAAAGRTVTVKLCRETAIRSCQIAGEILRHVSRQVGKLDQSAGRGGYGTK